MGIAQDWTKEIVYVLTNPAMPGFVKVGMTSMEELSVRLGQLYTTGVPFPFDLVFACKVPDATPVERALHKALAPYRARPSVVAARSARSF